MSLPLYLSSAPTRFNATQHNTGLWYDKFVNVWASGWAMREGCKLEWVKSVAGQRAGDNDQIQTFARRQHDLAEKLRGQSIAMMTATRFATGLGREHPIEIGFAWHHTLGTPYLPGSGVKGLVRAYVRECFGNAVASDLFGPDDFKAEHCVGKWIFFDAIPTKPVQLEADVMTPHYGPYYQGDAAPGDWHNPIPIPFLVVARDQHFQFAFAPRHPGDSGKDAIGNAVTNDTIGEWLTAALHWLGAGAKTNSGFGVFRRADEPSSSTLVSGKALAAGAAVDATSNKPAASNPGESKAPGSRRSFKATLELVTPAFLAGADQTDPTDCDLRPATLRGQLRYWWRTLHAGYLTIDELRALESALWGSTNGAGAIRVVVEPIKRVQPQLFDFRDGFAVRTDFQRAHDLQAPPPQTTQGLFYLSYGMNDGGRKRYFLPPGATWNVRLIARNLSLRGRSLVANDVLTQARAAFALLCRYGGVGSKARKGFGSLASVNFGELDDGQCEQIAVEFRRSSGWDNEFNETVVESASLRQTADVRVLSVATPWKDCWFLLDQLGAAMQAFAQAPESTGHGKHCDSKVALGLPRQIHGPRREPLPHQRRSGQHRQPVRLRGPKGDRHAAPVHYHIASSNDRLTIRVAAFPSANLPNLAASRTMLTQLLDHLRKTLAEQVNLHSTKGQRGATNPGESRATNIAQTKRPSGMPVRVKIIGVREKGGFDVQEEGRPKGVLNLGPVPSPPPNASDVVDVLIKDDAKPPQYQWKPVVAESKAKPAKGHGPRR